MVVFLWGYRLRMGQFDVTVGLHLGRTAERIPALHSDSSVSIHGHVAREPEGGYGAATFLLAGRRIAGV